MPTSRRPAAARPSTTRASRPNRRTKDGRIRFPLAVPNAPADTDEWTPDDAQLATSSRTSPASAARFLMGQWSVWTGSCPTRSVAQNSVLAAVAVAIISGSANPPPRGEVPDATGGGQGRTSDGRERVGARHYPSVQGSAIEGRVGQCGRVGRCANQPRGLGLEGRNSPAVPVVHTRRITVSAII